ncbi:MAG: DUF1211 domain-containing protein [Gammaproteobacteria bacterium]|nr:DUF1211 domain-containing protein [Gammaproteobacteria bacterium]
MHKARLETFSDGVIAIIITIMVLKLNIPQGTSGPALQPLVPIFLSYLLSFVFIGIYWSNHHHLFHAAKQVNDQVIWANLHLLFWLSLVPFTTAWMSQNDFAALPVALYGLVLLLADIAYFLLAYALVAHHGRDSSLAKARGFEIKGKLSMILYVVAIPLAFVSVSIAGALYVLAAIIWLMPHARVEKMFSS